MPWRPLLARLGVMTSTQTSDPFATPSWTPYPPSPPPGQAPQQPWWQRDGVVSRILVLAGVGVTLVGIVMLLVVAAQNGLLGPQVRVAGGVALALGLIAAGWRVMNRPGGRIGGIALQATGFAGLYLDVLAVTTFYEWVPPIAGLVAALGIAVAGVAVAMRWNTQSLAVIVNVCCALLAPALTRGVDTTLVAFLLVFAVVGAIPEIQRGWSALAPVRTVPVVLAATFALASSRASGEPLTTYAMSIAAGVLMVGLGTGLAAVRRRPHDDVAVVTMAMTPLPALAVGERLELWPGTAWYVVLALVLVAPVLIDRGLPRVVQTTLGVLAGVSLLCGTTVLTVGYQSALPFLVLALVLLAADLTRRAPIAHVLGQIALLIGGLVLLAEVTVDELVSATSAQHLPAATTLTAWIAATAAIVGALAAVRSRGMLAELRPMLLVGDVALAFYATTAGFVAAGVQVIEGPDGFSLGQFLATAAWMATAFGLLTLGLRRPERARVALTGGLALVAAALTKLFVFDLAALNGLGRGAAFLVVGLLLLAAGTRYARAFAERERVAS
jgi:uncharacterized membrane protein